MSSGVTFDSMLASFVLDPGRRTHAIDNLSFEHLNRRCPSSRHRRGQAAKACG